MIPTSRRKAFISYHHTDEQEVRSIIDQFSGVMIARGIGAGVSDDDRFIQSYNTEYVLEQIRERYLTDTSVTIVMVGRCTWARKYVDWEVAATLRNDPRNRRSGLLAIKLPSTSTYAPSLPQRVADNCPRPGRDGYGRYIDVPRTATDMAAWLEDAAAARVSRAHLIASPRRPLLLGNQPC